MERYHHTQVDFVILASIALAIAVAVFLFIYEGVKLSHFTFYLGSIIAILSLFPTMTITIDNQFISTKFGPGLICRKIILTDIESFKTVRYPWYTGWGIRLNSRGYLFNIYKEQDVIELRLKDGTYFRIGTDESETLSRALKMASELK